MFKLIKIISILVFLLLGGNICFADVLVVYPDAGTGGTTVDGKISTGLAAWATVHDATTANAAVSAASGSCVRVVKIGGDYVVGRGFFIFDTSALTAGATVSTATFSLAGNGIAETNGDTSTLHVIATTSASSNDLVDEDYDQVGSTSFGSLALSSWVETSGTYNDFSLNATGLAAISKTGVTKYGVRNSLDIDNSAPAGDNEFETFFADQTGTTNDPKLTITYTTASTGQLILID